MAKLEAAELATLEAPIAIPPESAPTKADFPIAEADSSLPSTVVLTMVLPTLEIAPPTTCVPTATATFSPPYKANSFTIAVEAPPAPAVIKLVPAPTATFAAKLAYEKSYLESSLAYDTAFTVPEIPAPTTTPPTIKAAPPVATVIATAPPIAAAELKIPVNQQ